MKHSLPAILLAALALATAAPAQTKPSAVTDAPAAKGDSIQIVFVPTKLFDEAFASGKLKENTFYWSTPTGNPEQTPVAMQEDGKPFMRIVGKFEGEQSVAKKPPGKKSPDTETTTPTKASMKGAYTRIIRAFNVPEDKQTATLNVVARTTYDLWGDQSKSDYAITRINLSITRDGKMKVMKKIPLEKNSGWKTYSHLAKIPDGTQQVVVEMEVVGVITLDINSLEITFS